MKRITFIIIATLLATALFSCSKSIVGRAEVRDLVLIYDGGTHRTIDWNKEKFAPYVATEPTATTQSEWLFDGFLFLEIFHDDNGQAQALGHRDAIASRAPLHRLICKRGAGVCVSCADGRKGKAYFDPSRLCRRGGRLEPSPKAGA